MIHRAIVEPDTPEWVQWKQECDRATKELVDRVAAWRTTQKLMDEALAGSVSDQLINKLAAEGANEEVIGLVRSGRATPKQLTEALASQWPKVKEKLYKRMRRVLFDAFFGKCAYCEARIILDQTGDVDHFRPKRQVLNENADPVSIGSGHPHLGYYWLAYDWHNLLPSCIRCNRMIKTVEGVWVGKGARFPVKGRWADEPGEEAGEAPLLINPVVDNPEDYLRFDETTGVICARDGNEKGNTTIRVFDLNREGLPEARLNVYHGVLLRMQDALYAVGHDLIDCYKKHLGKMHSYKNGAEEYSFAGRAAIQRKGPQFRQALEELVGLFQIGG